MRQEFRCLRRYLLRCGESFRVERVKLAENVFRNGRRPLTTRQVVYFMKLPIVIDDVRLAGIHERFQSGLTHSLLKLAG
ncbi:MAG: hypothetical protein D6696_13010 [Acidobacteria bacterium]|nr:MAG: hypothetical protein D6696_13010 [Acidobacteriota bacterium]